MPCPEWTLCLPEMLSMLLRMVAACTVQESGFDYAACEYSLIKPWRIFLRRTLA